MVVETALMVGVQMAGGDPQPQRIRPRASREPNGTSWNQPTNHMTERRS
jgi:hypothetical protein